MTAERRQAERRRMLVALNAHCRRGSDSIEPALEVFRRAGFEVEVEPAPKSREVPRALTENWSRADVIVLGGGDGTIHAAAADLIETPCPVGILPLGTANDLARTLDIPVDLSEAAEVIVAGHSRPIDVGDVNGEPFLNVASIGLGVDLKDELTGEVKRRWGKLSYAVACFLALKRLRLFTAQIRYDGETRTVRAVQIAVGNGKYYGGIATVDAEAELDDGRLNLYSIETESWLRLAAMVPDFLRGRHGEWHDVRRLSGAEFEVRTRRPKKVVADGEAIARTPARFTVRRGAVDVFVPRPAARGE